MNKPNLSRISIEAMTRILQLFSLYLDKQAHQPFLVTKIDIDVWEILLNHNPLQTSFDKLYAM